MSTAEYHIASYIAHALPENTESLHQFIHNQAGLEVHACNDTGKIVFTAEGESQHQLADLTDPVKNHSHTLTLSPIYHQFLSDQTAQLKDTL